MSYQLTADALNIETGSPMTKLVLLALCDYANDKNECWPSQMGIAQKCEMSEKTVQRHINKLKALKFVTIKKKTGSLNKYKISLPLGQRVASDRESGQQVRESLPTVRESGQPQSESPLNQLIEPTTNQLKQIPDFIDAKLWESYLGIRKNKKAADTEHAIDLILKKLIQFENEVKGNANKSLEASVISSWSGVFPPKKDFSKPNNQQGHFSNDFSQYEL